MFNARRAFPFALAIPALITSIPALATGTVVGMISSSSGPAASARVTLFTPSLSVFREARTAPDGTYTIAGIPDGDYRLGVAARGFDYQEIGVTIAPGGVRRDFGLAPESHPGSWDIIGTTEPEFFDATDIAILLLDGRIMYCHDTVDPIIFNPATGGKFLATSSGSEQGCMNSSLLPDGRVCMVGGQEGEDPGDFKMAVRWVKAYDPRADRWERLADLQNPTGRWYPGLARLADGSFLVMGGGTRPDAARTDTCERLDLARLTWSYTGSMVNPCEFPPSALLYTGEVLATWSPPQLYDPATGKWRRTGDFNQPDRKWPGHSDHSIVVLSDGRVLAVGIRTGESGPYTHMGEIYDPSSGTWTMTSSPRFLREQCEVVQMPDGRVLAAAGETKDADPPPNILGVVEWCDLYDPDTDTWRRVDDLNWFREYHAVTLLIPDGRIVTTGGTRIKFEYGPTSADIEAFSPPYLSRGVRPRIETISATDLARGQQITLSISPDTGLTSVVLMGTETQTHWVNGGIPRRLVLAVDQSGPTAKVTLPTDPNILPLGPYMLFAMVDDIPSVARIVQVTRDTCAPDCTRDGLLNINDFICMQAKWRARDPYGDYDRSGTYTINDFIGFQADFRRGCP